MIPKDILGINILDIQKLYDNSEMTVGELTQYYLDRIERYNDKINAVLEVNPDALEIAKEMDIELNNGKKRSLMHGIPVLIKDNINTFDKMHTTAGSIILKDLYAPYDAFIVKKLRESGAVILGKANLTEFANFISTESENGYSALGGQVINPYGKFDVGGSSSGSGAAVATGMCQVAIGTETSGSILSPSIRNSIVGIKPTVGLVSRFGIIPISYTQDTAGPMARNVTDSVILLNSIIGYDSKDDATNNVHTMIKKNYLNYLNPDGLKGKRIGYVKGRYVKDASDEEISIIDGLVNKLRDKCKIIDVNIPTEDMEVNYDVLYHEFPIALKKYFKTLGDDAPVKTLNDIIEFNKEDEKVRIPYGQEIFEQSINKKFTKDESKEVLKNSIEYSNGINKLLEKENLDALIFINYYGCDIAARNGYPSITIPCGYRSNGEPINITFTGDKFLESKLIEIALEVESMLDERKMPQL